MKFTKRLAIGGAIVVGGVVSTASPAFSYHCLNANKPPAAGVQVSVNTTNGDLVFANKGAAARAEKGLLTEDSFSGLFGLDFNGDGIVDASTFIVTPTGQIPETAQNNGSPDHGIITFSD